MNQILVTGRMSQATLERALYSGWVIKSFLGNDRDCVAVIEATDEGVNPDFQIGRLSSFGNVGVRAEFTDGDIAEAVERLGL